MVGKIFEPRDSYTNEIVLKEAQEVMGCTCYNYIGVTFQAEVCKQARLLCVLSADYELTVVTVELPGVICYC